jgi:hypothetical protein
MKRPTVYSLLLFFGLFVWIAAASARPVDFNEVSLLVRAHESESSIKAEVSRRKLMRALTPQQETT